MCIYIGSRTKDPDPLKPEYKYMYQRRFLEAACVDVNKDSEEGISKKVSGMWSKFEEDLYCNNGQFDVQNGSILKYAAVSKFDAFIDDIIKWKINLNRVDPTDKRTILDYVKYQKEKNAGNALEPILQEYYELLRDAGAKHKSEL